MNLEREILMKKSVLITIIVLSIVVIIVGAVIVGLVIKDGFLHIGDVWQNTPEEALSQRADQTIDTLQTLTIKTLIQKRTIDDITVMAFISNADTLVTVTFITNDNGQYSVYGYTEECDLDNPTEFVLNGKQDQSILFPYKEHNTTVYGWSYSNTSFSVGGVLPSTETYKFECQGKEYSLSYWWIDNFPTDIEPSITYN